MIWLIGAGPMAAEYAKVLSDLCEEIAVCGRSERSARNFESETGVPVAPGGLERFLLEQRKPADAAIVAASVDQLHPCALQLMEAGVKRILLEKPGGLNSEELRSLEHQASAHSTEVLVAYNRRFYRSVDRARELIEQDGGITSMLLEVTELTHLINTDAISEAVANRWFIANTSHVTDLAWHLGGLPRSIHAYATGSLPWHPDAAVFTGAGVTERDVLFAYHGDWSSAGRWSLEVCTPKQRLIFRPLETLQTQRKGQLAIQQVELDAEIDQRFKPGLHHQTTAFLKRDDRKLCTLTEQVEAMRRCEQIAGYQSDV